ncbi:MAG: DUF2202 domain-containing protein [Saprospiraceae bacterium]|nr:DUF2202 domain-containing protein [Saprospiraceae bacterium]
MKKLNSIIAVTLLVFTFLSCNKEEISPNNHTSGELSTKIVDFPYESLNEDEKSSLTFMREEEYLAYDVYVTLYNKWGINIFKNISESELTHTNAIMTLLNKYGLSDPADNHSVGKFIDSGLQQLYNQLVEKGKISQLEAFKVGATIEDLDIFDLNNWIAKVDNQDIKFVFQNLNKGSRNHLRSFYNQIISNGGVYLAQFISQEELDIIKNSPRETGF